MRHADIPRIEELGAELSFWNTYRELRRAKGCDPDLVLKEWAAEQEKSLTSPGPREEFAELCKDGCLPQRAPDLPRVSAHAAGRELQPRRSQSLDGEADGTGRSSGERSQQLAVVTITKGG
jgi:hypothetical protein